MYSFEQLDPRPQADNSKVLEKGDIYGIEVTIPALAEACDLGNIDPQHLGGDATRAAVEEALIADLPDDGSTLVTVRPDADSVGSMAVIDARREGWKPSEEALRRIGLIAVGDKEASGDWSGPKPIGSAEDLVTDFTILNGVASNFRIPLSERVDQIRSWITEGSFEGQEELRQRLISEAEVALSGLKLTVRESGLAVVEGNHRLAMQIGYSESPIVVATNPKFSFAGGDEHTKHTVARHNTSTRMNWDDAKNELNESEPGWGGSSSIMGSPQGVSSELSTEEVASIVEQHML